MTDEFYDEGCPPPERLRALALAYGVSTGQLRSWYIGGCGINGCTGTRLHIDHDHNCCRRTPTCGNCTRGVLCIRHNTGLEAFIDSPAVVAYLLRTPAGEKTLVDLGVSVDDARVQRTRRPRLTDAQREVHRALKHRLVTQGRATVSMKPKMTAKGQRRAQRRRQQRRRV